MKNFGSPFLSIECIEKKYQLESFFLEFHRIKAHKGLLTIQNSF